MNQEQLSLETCKEIGHLFPESEKTYYSIEYCAFFGEEHIVLCERKNSKGKKFLANHPSITDMMEWLWAKNWLSLVAISDSIYRIVTVGPDGEIILTDYDDIEADAPIEAYAESVKLVMEEER